MSYSVKKNPRFYRFSKYTSMEIALWLGELEFVSVSIMSAEKQVSKNTTEKSADNSASSASTIGKSNFQTATENVGAAAYQFAKSTSAQIMKQARRLNDFVAENHWSLRFLSILGFLLVLILSILALVGKLQPFLGSEDSTSRYIMNFYLIFFSSANLLSESSDKWPVFGRIRQFMFDLFGFLKHNLGRGLYNIFFGLVFCSLWNFPVMLVGVYVILVGLLFVAAYNRGEPKTTNGHSQLQEQN